MTEMIHIAKDELEELMKTASHAAAKEALAAVGLSDELAGSDIRDMRSLLRAYRETKTVLFRTFFQRAMDLTIMAIIVGLSTYFFTKGEMMK